MLASQIVSMTLSIVYDLRVELINPHTLIFLTRIAKKID